MTEILFYHLQRQPLERVLPTLIEKSARARLAGGRAGRLRKSGSRRSTRICGPSATTAFFRTGHGARPKHRSSRVLLTVHGDNPNGAAVRFLDRRARRCRADAGGYQRIVLTHSTASDPEAVAAARALGEERRRHYGEGHTSGP